MTRAKWDPERLAKVSFAPPGQGVFKILVQDSKGVQVGDFFMTGQPEQHQIMLPSGEYFASIIDVGNKAAIQTAFAVEGAASQSIELDMPEPPSIQGGFLTTESAPFTKPSVMPRSPKNERYSVLSSHKGARRRQSRRRPDSGSTLMNHADSAYGDSLASSGAPDLESATVPVANESYEEAFADEVSSAIEQPASDGLAFDIGLSEDRNLGKRGGWEEPNGLLISKEVDSKSGVLKVDIEDRAQEIRKARVRISCSIGGHQTIRAPVPLYRGGVSILFHPRRGKETVDFWIEIKAKDPAAEVLVVALAEMSREDAVSTLESGTGELDSAILFLAKKQDDYWAASLAALILARTGNVGDRLQWFENLAKWAPHIADAPIAAAWAVAATGEGESGDIERRIFELLEDSVAIGAPTFATGHMMGLELLDSLRSSAVAGSVRNGADRRYRQWTERSKSRLFDSPYLIWEHLGETLTKGRLPDARYLSIASGELGRKGFISTS